MGKVTIGQLAVMAAVAAVVVVAFNTFPELQRIARGGA